MDFTLMLEQGLRELSTHGAFLTMKSGVGLNTMTISWGFVGFMWGKPHFIAVVRPQRHTKTVLDGGADSFTVSVPFGEALKQELNVCGTQSGRDIDKSQVVRFKEARLVNCPVVGGCGLYYECRINLAQQMEGSLMPPNVKRHYDNDFHHMVFGEIVACYAP